MSETLIDDLDPIRVVHEDDGVRVNCQHVLCLWRWDGESRPRQAASGHVMANPTHLVSVERSECDLFTYAAAEVSR